MTLRIITTVLFVLFAGVGVRMVGVYTYKKITALTEERRRKQLAAKNMDAFQREICRECQKKVNPEVDLYDKERDAWWHRVCYQKLIG